MNNQGRLLPENERVFGTYLISTGSGRVLVLISLFLWLYVTHYKDYGQHSVPVTVPVPVASTQNKFTFENSLFTRAGPTPVPVPVPIPVPITRRAAWPHGDCTATIHCDEGLSWPP